ncbi:hypothetical protein PIB30_059748 [Stylosanthes scabra]|uniref:Uncharacterized protein n=1 Tax=Stylosanthes scabra TaxID=79078 RepID=A0ABU6WIN5_9FABA|nr:hypothetical protein [Stylosanthes scabra]
MEHHQNLLRGYEDTLYRLDAKDHIAERIANMKEEAAISPIPAEEEKKKKEPTAYMPKPPYPQKLKAENKNKAPKKEPKEEMGATNDSVKFQQIQKVPTMPYLPTIMGINNKTYMITEGVCNKFFEPP